MNDYAVVVDGVKKSFYNKQTGLHDLVLNNISFCAAKGEVTVLMGQSGCGKSTLFNILIGQLVADDGHVEILQFDISQRAKMQEVKKHFGILFQYGALFNSMNVAENIKFPIYEHQPQLHPDIVDIMAEIKLRQVELNPQIYRHKAPSVLSGGEKKRVGLARALALDPLLIFYDEPSAGLDPIVSRKIDQLIVDLTKILKISAIVITHELDSAFAIADRMILLKRAEERHQDQWQGTIVFENGTPTELQNSQKPYTVEFLAEHSHYKICPKCHKVSDKKHLCCK